MVFLDRIVSWEARVFLGEEDWKFEIAQEQDRFVRRILKKMETVPKRTFILPFDYSRTKGLVGHIDGNSVWIRLKAAESSWLSYFGCGAVCHFQGKFDLHNDSLILRGSYRLTPILRAALLFFVAAVILSAVGMIAVAIIVLSMNFHWEFLVRSTVVFFGTFVPLFASFALGQIIYFVTRNERHAIYELLNETSLSLSSLPPKDVAGGT